jgi:hypothetical protein
MSRNPWDDELRVSSFDERRSDNTEKLKEKVEDIASRTKQTAGEWANTASETMDRQRQNVSAGLGRVASTLHEKAANIPGGPRAVEATHRVADGMESAASYLREHDLADMGNDLLNICRKYPVQTLVSAIAVGFLVGRSVRK